MPSKSGKKKKKGQASIDPVLTAVMEEVAAAPAAAAVLPAPDEGDQSTADPGIWGPLAAPSLPTTLDSIGGPVPDDHTPDDAIGILNHLVGQGAIGKEEFDTVYLHHLGPLGATQQDADEHWAALQQKLEAEPTAAQQLAAEMVEQTKPLSIAPWDPAADPVATETKITEMRRLFNRMVAVVKKGKSESGSPHHLAGYVKDRIASALSARAHLLQRGQRDDRVMGGDLQRHPAPLDRAPGRGCREVRAPTDRIHRPSRAALSGSQPELRQDEGHGGEAGRRHVRDVAAVARGTGDQGGGRLARDEMVGRNVERGAARDRRFEQAARGVGAPRPDEQLEPQPEDRPSPWREMPATCSALEFPASHVIGCCFTGAGCLREHEFVVLGGTDVKVSAVSRTKAQWKMPATAWAA